MLSFSYIKNPDTLTAQSKQNENVNQSQLKIERLPGREILFMTLIL